MIGRTIFTRGCNHEQDERWQGTSRTHWLDEKTDTPLIDEYVQKLGSFLEAMADGRIDASELKTQEDRVVALMKTDRARAERRASRTGHAPALRAIRVQHHAYDPSARGNAAQDQVPGLIDLGILPVLLESRG